jgi:hypothetical protein
MSLMPPRPISPEEAEAASSPAPRLASTRQGYLSLGSRQVWLDDLDRGWACQELNVGYPSVREVVNNRPDQHGTDDQTAYFGSRAVTANITSFRDRGTMAIDDIAALFAPFMVPAARPVLTYSTHSNVGRWRRLTLRPADFTSPMNSIAIRSIHLGFVAPDPVARDIEQSVARGKAGDSVRDGRYYDGPPARPATDFGVIDSTGNTGWGFHPDRQYPEGGSDPTVGRIFNAGDVPISPLLRVWGPIDGPIISGGYLDIYANMDRRWRVVCRPSLHIDEGQYVDIDTDRKTAVRGGTCQSVLAQVAWMDTTWPAISPGATSDLRLEGTSTRDATMVEAFWRNGYLT